MQNNKSARTTLKYCLVNSLRIVVKTTIIMESQQQQLKYAEPTSLEVVGTPEQASLADLLPAAKSNQQWQRLGTQISTFFAQLPDYVGGLFNKYKQPIITVALIVVAFISFRVVLEVIDALNGIPLLVPTFELIGIGYSVWFVNRYLLKMSKRQELYRELQALKGQVVGSQQPPES